MMAISDWPLAEQPRQKLQQQGARSLSDAELLAIILRIGSRGQSAIDLARHLLQHTGGLRQLLQSESTQILKIPGIGPSKFVQLQALAEISRRYFAEQSQQKLQFNTSSEVKRFILSRLRDYQHEVFAALFLNSHNQLIRFECLFQGTINQSPVFPRQVLKKALDYNAHALIIAHNHPSGDPQPSENDRRITKLLINTLGLVDIIIHDHIIVGDNQLFSFAEHGLL